MANNDDSQEQAQADAGNNRDPATIRVGGDAWHWNSYPDAYFQASTQLFNALQDRGDWNRLAKPLLFLQRHTLEITIKETLHICEAAIVARGGTPPVRKQNPSHDLRQTQKELRDAMRAAGVEQDWPTDLDHLVDEFVKIDAAGGASTDTKINASRLRYSTTQLGAPSFSSPFYVDIRDIQNRLWRLLFATVENGRSFVFTLQAEATSAKFSAECAESNNDEQ